MLVESSFEPKQHVKGPHNSKAIDRSSPRSQFKNTDITQNAILLRFPSGVNSQLRFDMTILHSCLGMVIAMQLEAGYITLNT
jgi:hypothetical protein